MVLYITIGCLCFISKCISQLKLVDSSERSIIYPIMNLSSFICGHCWDPGIELSCQVKLCYWFEYQSIWRWALLMSYLQRNIRVMHTNSDDHLPWGSMYGLHDNSNASEIDLWVATSWVNIGLGNGLLPADYKPLPVAMLSVGSIAFTWGQFHRKCSWCQSIKPDWILHISNYCHISQGPNDLSIQ